MMETADRSLFLFLNSFHSPFFDEVMWVLSMKAVWVPMYLLIIYLLARIYHNRIWTVLLVTALLVLITDQVSVLIKTLVERPRPCHEPSLAGLVHVVRGNCGGMFGFVSSHAANTFGVAAYTAPLIKKKWYTWCIFVWASLVSYSRIYLGVHYPGDVLGGMILGLAAGSGLAAVVKLINRRNA